MTSGFSGWRDTSLDRPLPAGECPETLYHVTAAANRESIREHGLDWRRMRGAPGLATGGELPEEPCNYLAHDLGEADFFVTLCNHAQPLDIWEVQAGGLELVRTGDGWIMSPQSIQIETEEQAERWSSGSGGFIEWER